MKKAGYPGGMDPETGRNLELTFDQAGSSVRAGISGSAGCPGVWRRYRSGGGTD